MHGKLVLKSMLLVGVFLFWTLPQAPPDIYAGGCDYDLTGAEKKCDGHGGNVCNKGVKTCGSGKVLSSCTDGTKDSNGGKYFCEIMDSWNCEGIQYHPKTNKSGCMAIEEAVEMP